MTSPTSTELDVFIKSNKGEGKGKPN